MLQKRCHERCNGKQAILWNRRPVWGCFARFIFRIVLKTGIVRYWHNILIYIVEPILEYHE